MKKQNNWESNFDIVYVIDEHCFGRLISPGAHASKIHYINNGIEYEVDLLNEDFYIVQEVGIQHIEEVL